MKHILTASELGVKELYRYEPFNNDDHEEWLTQTLKHNTIHLSNPANFNDPWDCKPWYNTENLDDPQTMERYIEYTDKSARAVGLQTSEEEHAKRLQQLRDDPKFYRKIIEDTSRGMWEDIATQCRVYCLSTKPHHSLMWSYYADKHQGICLEFASDKTIFSTAYKVIYGEKFPNLDFADTTEEHNITYLMAKSAAWVHEDEFRIIALEKKALKKDYGGLTTENNYLKIDGGSLKSVILGCRMNEPLQKRIVEIIEKHSNGVKIKKASITPNRYNLNIESFES